MGYCIWYGGGAPTILAVNYKEPVKIMVEKVKWPNGTNGTVDAEEGDAVKIHPDPSRENSGSNVRKGITNALNTYTGCGSGVVVKENDRMKKEIMVEGRMADTKFIQAAHVYGPDGISPTVVTAGGTGSKIKMVDDRGNETELTEGDVVAMHTPGRIDKRQNGPRFNDGTKSFTVTAADKDGIAQNTNGNLRIRYLTPRECLRLQAFPDDAIDKLLAAESKSQCYKLAGNSIAVCCLKAIFKGIYIDRTFRKGGRQISLNRWF